jgi:hypothetical protein
MNVQPMYIMVSASGGSHRSERIKTVIESSDEFLDFNKNYETSHQSLTLYLLLIQRTLWTLFQI